MGVVFHRLLRDEAGQDLIEYALLTTVVSLAVVAVFDILRDSIANVVAKTGRSEAEARAGFARSNPQGRLVQPDEVAAAVRWLCSDGAAAVTGVALPVAGGEVS